MNRTLKKSLLATRDLGEFLVTLRGSLSQREVMELLQPHGGPRTPQAVQHYEQRGSISSTIQYAYVQAFGLDAEVRLRLQELAGGATERACA